MSKKVLEFGVCVGNNDPALSGRIRGVLDSDYGTQQPIDYDKLVCSKIARENGFDTAEQIHWTELDPHIVSPFLPSHINIVPQKGENITVLLFNPEKDTLNRVYVGPTISQPHKLEYENYNSGRLNTSKGNRIIRPKNITDSDVSKNVFPFPDKIAINGRKNSDLIFGDNEVLLRAGNFLKNEQIPEFPFYNDRLSAIQITNFPTKLTREKITLEEKIIEKIPIKYLIEYTINNLENIEDSFNGSINLIEVIQDNQNIIDTSNVTIGSIVNSNNVKTSLVFFGQPMSGVTNLVNEFLLEVQGVTRNLTTPPFNVQDGQRGYSKVGDFIDNFGTTSEDTSYLDLYPFYYRPSFELQRYMTSNDNSEQSFSVKTNNVRKLLSGVRLAGVNNNNFYGLYVSRNQISPTVETKKINTVNNVFDDNNRQGVINMISDTILLYSHQEKINNKNKTNPLVKNENNPEIGDNMGVDQSTLVQVRDEQTEPLVRGEQLVELLTEIVLFLTTHTHGEPGTEPVETPLDQGQRLLDKLLTRSFLNENIRIN